MTRSKSLTTAAILQLLLGLIDAISALPILAAGSQGLPAQPGFEAMGGPPFWAGVLFIVLAIASLFGAHGVWVNQRWGKVLAIITRVVTGLFALGDIIAAVVMSQYGLAALAVVYVLVSILVVVLVLRREPARVVA